MNTTHDPDVIERIAEAMFVTCYGPGHTITYQRLRHDGDPETEGVFCKPYWRRQAETALSVIDELYEEENNATWTGLPTVPVLRQGMLSDMD